MEERLAPANPLGSLSSSLPIDSILLIGFLCLLAAYIIYAVILHYHWSNYSASKTATWWTYIVFAGSTLPLLAIIGLTALSY